MPIIYSIYHTFLDALFPISSAEKELFSYSPETAYKTLPSAPAYSGLVVALPEARSIFAYADERVSKLVWNIKYNRSAPAVAIGGYALYHALFIEDILHVRSHQESVSIIPIPITNRRRRERGFNQCELLADEMKRLDVDNSFTIKKDLLVRAHHSSRQTLKGRADRVEGARGIFELNEEAAQRFEKRDSRFKKNTMCIIIDDVITTGSTMKEAIETLKKAGFGRVYGLSLAH